MQFCTARCRSEYRRSRWSLRETATRKFAVIVGPGLSTTDALRSAMTVAARTRGLKDEIGRIGPGFAADVIAVEGNPLETIRVMEDVRFVMRAARGGGEVAVAAGRPSVRHGHPSPAAGRTAPQIAPRPRPCFHRRESCPEFDGFR